MSPKNERSRPPKDRLATTTLDADQRNPCARAYIAPPCPGRSLWLVVVLTCPLCRTAHTHRVRDADLLMAGRVVRFCPTVGKLYRIAAVQRRREAVRRGR